MRILLLLLTMLVIVTGGVAPNKAIGQDAVKTIDQLEDERSTAWYAINEKTLWGKVEALTLAKKYQCLKAFGHSKFCDCFSEKAAVGLSFKGYVAATALTKKELGYDKWDEENRKLHKIAHKTREVCVSRVFGNPFADLIPRKKP